MIAFILATRNLNIKKLFGTTILIVLSLTLTTCATAQAGNASTTTTSGNQAALTWTLATISEEIPSYMGSVAYGNGRFIAAGRMTVNLPPKSVVALELG